MRKCDTDGAEVALDCPLLFDSNASSPSSSSASSLSSPLLHVCDLAAYGGGEVAFKYVPTARADVPGLE